MIFVQLFLSFLKIGTFTFGGGYAMIALIQNEVVVNQGWISAQEFTDILAVSQTTPGPIGINTATYTGYTAVVNAGYGAPWAVCGALLSSVAVILVPVVLMLLVSRFFARYKDHPVVAVVLRVVRLAIVGLIASAAWILFTPENFGTFAESPRQFWVSVALFAIVFVVMLLPKGELRWKRFTLRKPGPIALILMAGLVGLLVYGGC